VIRRIILVMLTLALAAGISACGKKSDLEPPPGEKSEYPRTYPQ
jgi:predicted small lipoprotein YifL